MPGMVKLTLTFLVSAISKIHQRKVDDPVLYGRLTVCRIIILITNIVVIMVIIKNIAIRKKKLLLILVNNAGVRCRQYSINSFSF